MIVWRMGTIVLEVMNMPASLDLAADYITNLIICVIVRTAPFSLVTGSYSERKLWAPDRLLSLDLFRYPALDWADRVMLLA